MHVKMLRDKFGEDRALYSSGGIYTVPDSLGLQFIGEGAAVDQTRPEQQFGPGWEALVSNFPNSRNVGTRVPFGRFGTIDNSTAKTFHVTAELGGEFRAARPVFGNTDSARSYQAAGCKISTPTSVADDASLLNNAGTWVSVTRSALPVFSFRAGHPGSTAPNRIAYTTPDWIQLSSVARTDGGQYPLIACRMYPNDTTATALPVYGNGADDFTNWATRTDGLLWAARQFNGDGVTTPTNFTGGTSATPQSQSPIIGFQYLPRIPTITVCGVGDSNTEGRGTYLGEGFILPACRRLSRSTGINVEYFNAGVSGQSLFGATGGINGFAARALDILDTAEILPDVLVMPVFSPNEEAVTITQAGIDGQERAIQTVIAECKRKRVGLVLWTGLPANAAVRPWGASDALRVAYNATALARFGNVVDLASVLSGPIVSGQVTLLHTLDNIHANDTGNLLLSLALESSLLQAISGER